MSKFNNLALFVSSNDVSTYPDEKVKREFHRLSKLVLDVIRRELNHEQASIRSNQGGIAVGGEITLHTNRIYIQIHADPIAGKHIMYRSCKHKRDFTGGANFYMSLDELASNTNHCVEVLKRAARKD